MRMTAMLFMGTLVLAGCGVEMLATTAIRGEMEARQAQTLQRHLQYAQDKVDSVNVDQAIQAYRAEHGANPPSLQALVPQYLAAVPLQPDGTPYPYDPVSGRIGVAGPGPAPEDLRMMEDIRSAINRYGTATGFFPPTLDALYPHYLSRPPRTSANEPFIYNNQNGYLAHPRQQAQMPGLSAPATPRHTGGAGVGPMGEIMTGIGIQQELGRMGTGGASAAQTRSRGNVQSIGDGHTQQQNRVMDQLGL